MGPVYRDFEAWWLLRNLGVAERALAKARGEAAEGNGLPKSALKEIKAWREQALRRLAHLRRRRAHGRWPKG